MYREPVLYVFDPEKRKPTATMQRRGRLTDKLRKVLTFVVDRVDDTGEFPAVKSVAEHMGWEHPQTARNSLSRLAMHGYLQRSGGLHSGKYKPIKWELTRWAKGAAG